MEELGFEHEGFHKGFHPILQVRYHSVLDLKDKTSKDILKGMDSLRKRNTKKVQKMVLKFVSYPKMNYLFSDHLWKILLKRKEFADRDDSFYYNRFKHFKDRVLVPLAYIDFDEYIEELNNERDVLNKDLNKALKDIEKRPDNKKAYNKRIIFNNN